MIHIYIYYIIYIYIIYIYIKLVITIGLSQDRQMSRFGQMGAVWSQGGPWNPWNMENLIFCLKFSSMIDQNMGMVELFHSKLWVIT